MKIKQLNENFLDWLVKVALVDKDLCGAASKLLAAYSACLEESLASLKQLEGANKILPDAPQAEQSGNILDVPPEWIRFNFNNYDEFTHTAPVYCSIADVKLPCTDWADLLVSVVRQQFTVNSKKMDELYRSPIEPRDSDLPSIVRGRRPNKRYADLKNGCWVMTNLSASQKIKQIVKLCLCCGYTPEQIIIYGVPTEKHRQKS